MNNAAQRVKTVIQELAWDSQRYQALNDLLEQQRDHIIMRRTEELNTVNVQIMAHYQLLKTSGQQRYKLLEDLGIQPSSYGMQTLISRLPAPHRQNVSGLWRTLLQQAANCHTANEYNGELLNMQQDILGNLLNAGEPENWLYQQA